MVQPAFPGLTTETPTSDDSSPELACVAKVVPLATSILFLLLLERSTSVSNCDAWPRLRTNQPICTKDAWEMMTRGRGHHNRFSVRRFSLAILTALLCGELPLCLAGRAWISVIIFALLQ